MDVVAGCTSLLRLDLGVGIGTTSLAPLSVLKCLEELSIDGGYDDDDGGGMSSLAPLLHLPRLQKISLAPCSKLVGLEGLTALRHLKLGYCKMLTSLGPLAHLTALESLDVDEMDLVDDLAPLATLKSLEVLSISGSPQLTSMEPLRGLNINKLGLWNCGFSSLVPLAGLNGLTDLTLFGVDCSLEVVTELTGLRRLSIEECDMLTSLSSLAHLTALEFTGIDNDYGDGLDGLDLAPLV